MMYFVGSEQEDAALELRQSLIDSDPCCFQIVDSVIGLPRVISTNFKSELTRLARDVSNPESSRSCASGDLAYRGLPKATLACFGNAGELLFERLGIPNPMSNSSADGESAPLRDLGREALLWLLDNKGFSFASHEATIGSIIPSLVGVERRWGMRAACRSAINGDFHDVYERLASSLEAAGATEDWQYGVALVDLRNYATLKGDMSLQFDAQSKIDKLDSPVVFPACEHFLCKVDGELRDIAEWKRGLSVNSRGFNSKYVTALEAFLDFYFAAVLYGCYSRMYYARKRLADLLASFSVFYDDSGFAYHSLRLRLVGGDEKGFKNMCKCDWARLSNVVSGNADGLWKAAQACEARNAISMQCACVSVLAPYLSEQTMESVEALLGSELTMKQALKQWASAIKSISMRMNADTLVIALTRILETENPLALSCFNTLLSNTDWDCVAPDSRARFSGVFSTHLEWFLESGQSVEPIAKLLRLGILDEGLTKAIGDKLTGLQKIAFEGALADWQDYMSLFEASVEMAIHQFKANSSRNGYTLFSANPYSSIDISVNNLGASALDTETGHKLLRLFAKAANSSVPDEILAPMLGSMAVCAACFIREELEIPDTLISSVGKLRRSSSTVSAYMFGGPSEAAWQARLSAVRFVCGLGAVDEVVGAYLSSRGEYDASRALTDLSPEMISVCAKTNAADLQTLALVLSELAASEYPEVRKIVPKGAVELLSTDQSDFGYRLLYILVRDDEPEVRFCALRACADKRVKREFRNDIVELLCRDASFHLRHHAKKMCESGNDA